VAVGVLAATVIVGARIRVAGTAGCVACGLEVGALAGARFKDGAQPTINVITTSQVRRYIKRNRSSSLMPGRSRLYEPVTATMPIKVPTNTWSW
jgi:hypothetical protein